MKPIRARCDICGIEALDADSFAEERLPFRRAKKYCPACHARYYQRVYAGSILLLLSTLIGSGTVAAHRGLPLLDNRATYIALITLLQYPLVVPHELGHAIIGRLLGFSEIRILIGGGKPLWRFRFLGFDWLINRIPLGGFTIAKPHPLSFTRGKWILLAAAGLIVNGVLAAIAGILLWKGTVINGFTSPTTADLTKAFFWANLIVIGLNLAPYTETTPFGALDTDGKLLYNAIFFWKKPRSERSEAIPVWQIWAARVLKALLCVFLGVCTLGLIAIVGTFAFLPDLKGGLLARLALGGLFAFFAVLLGHYTWRLYSEPVALKRPNQARRHVFGSFENTPRTRSAAPATLIRSIRDYLSRGEHAAAISACEGGLTEYKGDEVLLLLRAASLCAIGNYTEAELECDKMLGRIEISSALYPEACGQKVAAIMGQGDADRFGSSLSEFVGLPFSDARKVFILDQLASSALYTDRRDLFQSAKLCAVTALEIEPGNLSLRGTLGALLLEEGEFDEAEPHLRACYDRSPALHDRGISGVYLALVNERRGDFKKATTLADQSLLLYSESWLKRKAESLFNRLASRPAE